jgi:polyisoprenoid-binding protein YceI
MNKSLIALIGLTSLTTLALAEPESFDFKDPKGVNNAVFKLDATLEAIQGSANGITGLVTFDPENPGATKGSIVVAASTLNVPNPIMKGHLHSAAWLDVEKYTNITFVAKELKNVKTEGNNTTADALGTLTIKDVSREITAPVKLTYLKDKLGQRVPNMKGDLLVIRSTFTIKRSDFGINPSAPEASVSNDIEISLSVAGAAPR